EWPDRPTTPRPAAGRPSSPPEPGSPAAECQTPAAGKRSVRAGARCAPPRSPPAPLRHPGPGADQARSWLRSVRIQNPNRLAVVERGAPIAYHQLALPQLLGHRPVGAGLLAELDPTLADPPGVLVQNQHEGLVVAVAQRFQRHTQHLVLRRTGNPHRDELAVLQSRIVTFGMNYHFEGAGFRV